MTVPSLITSQQAEDEIIGKSYRKLIDTYGLPTRKEQIELGNYISSWEMGNENSTVTSIYWGIGYSSGNSYQKRWSIHVDQNNIATKVQTFGYKLGNEQQVEATKNLNFYLSMNYGVAIGSIIYSWIILNQL